MRTFFKDRVYTTREAAEGIGRPISTLMLWIYQGRIRATKNRQGRWEITGAEIQRINRWTRERRYK